MTITDQHGTTYKFKTPLANAITYELRRWECLREDEDFYREMKIDSLRLINSWIEKSIEKCVDAEEYQYMETVITD